MEIEARTLRNVRVIARLDIKQGRLIKGVQMEGWRKVGDPAEYAKKYSNSMVDELLLMDVVASLYKRNSLHELVSSVASEVFVPLTVGGGIRSIDDAYALFQAGADKVAINTAATENPNLIAQLADAFGSQAIVVSIETLNKGSHYEVMTDNGRNLTGLEAISWARDCEQLGAGEILLTSIEYEGTGNGFDINISKKITDAVTIPVIAGGGLGNVSHIRALVQNTDVSSFATAQALHWNKLALADIRETMKAMGIYTRSELRI